MQFAIGIPWWALVLLAAALVAVAWGAYAGAIVPLSWQKRTVLVALRALTLLLLAACLLRPVRVMPPDQENKAIVPILVDASRSMRLADADGRPRIDAARAIVSGLNPQLAARFKPEIWTFGSELTNPAVTGPLPPMTSGAICPARCAPSSSATAISRLQVSSSSLTVAIPARRMPRRWSATRMCPFTPLASARRARRPISRCSTSPPAKRR